MKEIALGQKTFSINRETDHNFEFVATINDVTFINDSKATNAKHAVESINSLDAEIVLILGGDDLKTDYSWFNNINYYNIKTVIYYGRRFAEIKNIFNKHVMVIVADNLESAVEASKAKAIKNQAVLFSPACPSFDPFDNYKNRGNKFKELILKGTEQGRHPELVSGSHEMLNQVQHNNIVSLSGVEDKQQNIN